MALSWVRCFFVIYINDLHRAVGEDYVRLFEDDAALFLWNWNLRTLIESTETKFTDLQKQINHKLWENKFYSISHYQQTYTKHFW